MRILAAGDHHFDEHRRFAECIRIHQFIAEVAREQRPDVFCSAGDVYERASTPVEREAVADWVHAITETCPLLIVRGNHDRRRDLAILARLKTRHPVIVEEAAAVHRFGDLAVAALAWPNVGNVAAMLGRALPPDTVDAVVRELLREVLVGLGAQLSQHAGPRLLLTHAMIDGSVTSLGQPMIGLPINMSLAELALTRADMVIAGHIHKPQDWTHGGVPIAYTGSPFRTAFGEVEEKSILLAELSARDQASGITPSWQRIPTPATSMLLLAATWTGAGWATPLPEPEAMRGAEVRLRYVVAPDQRAAARRAADEWVAAARGAGAADVKPEPEETTTSVARAPEVAAASSTWGKLTAFWRSKGTSGLAERLPGLEAKLAAVEGTDAARATRATGSLRFLRLRARAMHPFLEVDLDLDKLAGPLVGITGANGEGKSTLMGLFPAAVYRRLPVHGALDRLARSPDSSLEVALVVGETPWLIRHTFSGGGTGKVTGRLVHVEDAAGQPRLGTGMVSEFDAWREPAGFGPAEQLYAGAFAVQKQQGFVGMGAQERKDTILELVGGNHLAALAKQCGDEASILERVLAMTLGKLAVEKPRAAGLQAAEWALEGAHRLWTSTVPALQDARERLEASRAARAAWRAALERAVAAGRARADLERRVFDAKRDLERSRCEVEGGERLMQRAAAIRDAAARCGELANEEAEVNGSIALARQQAFDEDRRATELDRQNVAALGRKRQAEERAEARRQELAGQIGKWTLERATIAKSVAKNRGVLERAGEIRAACARFEAIAGELSAVRETIRQLETKWHALERAAMGHATEMQAALGTAVRAGVRADHARRRLADREAVEAAVAEVERCDVRRFEDAAAAAYEDATRAQERVAAATADRIPGLQGALREVVGATELEQATLIAKAALDADAERATLAERGQTIVGEAIGARARASDALRSAQTQRRRAEILAARSGEMVAASEELAAATAEGARAKDTAETERALFEEARDARDAMASTRETCDERALVAEREALKPTVDLLEPLAEANARIAGHEERAAQRLADEALAAAELASIPPGGGPDGLAAEQEAAAARTGADEARAAAAGSRAAALRGGERLGAIAEAIVALREQAGLLPALIDAETLADERGARLRLRGDTAAALDQELAGMVPEEVPPRPAETEPLAAAVDAAEREGAARVALTRAEVAVEQARGAVVLVAQFDAERVASEATIADWGLLADGLGKNGVQAAEVDAAGPGLAARATDLLHRCHGPRYTVTKIDTAPMTADGKRETKGGGCDVMLRDSKEGREGKVETFSPGQLAIVSAAVYVALALERVARSGGERPTLFFDEADAGVDEEGARAWVKMLRMAADICGAHRVLLVSHSRETWESCDTTLLVANGAVVIT